MIGEKGYTMKKYYAIYKESEDVMVFDTVDERDEFVREERIVHPDCTAVAASKIEHLIKEKNPVFDDSFGCYAILA